MTSDLIRRLEVATEGNWRLNEGVAIAIGWQRNDREHWWRDPEGKQHIGGPPHFTLSLDAAMTLVPEGYAAQFSVSLGIRGYQHFAEVWDETTDDTRPAYEATAATAPLALCIAALKARRMT